MPQVFENYKRFADQFKITIAVSAVDPQTFTARTGIASDDHLSYWRCVLKKPRCGTQREMTVYMQSPDEPTVERVLHMLIYDAYILEQAPDFRAWLRETGLELDEELPAYSPKQPAHRAWRLARQYRRKLISFLSLDLYDVLLWQVR